MTDNGKLFTLLDDPEVRQLIFGLAHVDSALPPAAPGPARLHATVLHLAETTNPEQYRSWLSDDTSNKPMTVDQVRTTIGDAAIDDLAQSAGASPGAVTWQLAGVLPDLVDAASPGERSSTRCSSAGRSRKRSRTTTGRPAHSATEGAQALRRAEHVLGWGSVSGWRSAARPGSGPAWASAPTARPARRATPASRPPDAGPR